MKQDESAISYHIHISTYLQDHAQAVQASILLEWTRIGRP